MYHLIGHKFVRDAQTLSLSLNMLLYRKTKTVSFSHRAGVVERIEVLFSFRKLSSNLLGIVVQVRDREPSLGRGAKVVAVSLDKVQF